MTLFSVCARNLTSLLQTIVSVLAAADAAGADTRPATLLIKGKNVLAMTRQN